MSLTTEGEYHATSVLKEAIADNPTTCTTTLYTSEIQIFSKHVTEKTKYIRDVEYLES